MNTKIDNSENVQVPDVPDMNNIDYSLVRNIDGHCFKGISCNLCDSIDRNKGHINSCIKKYALQYPTKRES